MLHFIKPFLVGLAMGIADIIPGVSGGTIAFISGVYDTLIESISRINKRFIQLIFQARWKEAWIYIHGTFLVKLFFGIITAILGVAKLMEFLLERHTMLVFSFFFGLVISSIRQIRKHHEKPSHKETVGAIVIGAGIGFFLTTSGFIGSTSVGRLSVFFAGMFASIAMILPGISGSYILLLLGKYTYILGLVTTQTDSIKKALQTKNFSMVFDESTTQIIIFIGGVIVGLLGFSKVLHWLLKNHKNTTIAVLIGFMIGALPVIFPRTNTLIFGTMQGVRSVIYALIGFFIIWGMSQVQSK